MSDERCPRHDLLCADERCTCTEKKAIPMTDADLTELMGIPLEKFEQVKAGIKSGEITLDTSWLE